MAVFRRKGLLLCGLKTVILLRFITLQLFASYSKLATYMSAATKPLDIIVYAFFSNLESLEAVAFTSPCVFVACNLFCEFQAATK